MGILLDEVVHDADDEVLHLGVGHIEHELRAAASLGELACGMGHYPVGMCIKEFALGVGHLRFNPDAELQAAVLGSLEQSWHTVGQLLGVGDPVAKSLSVVRAAVLTAKPSVVDNEELAAQFLDAVHHLFANLLIDIHIHTFPRVE